MPIFNIYAVLLLFADANDDYCDDSRLRFKTFDLEKVLTHGAHLMGSEGKEYDIEEDSNPITGNFIYLKIKFFF